MSGDTKIKKYRKLPVEIEAVQVNDENMDNIVRWINSNSQRRCANTHKDEIDIFTLEGNMRAQVGDWVIRGIAGEFYPCRDDIFRETYEEIE